MASSGKLESRKKSLSRKSCAGDLTTSNYLNFITGRCSVVAWSARSHVMLDDIIIRIGKSNGETAE